MSSSGDHPKPGRTPVSDSGGVPMLPGMDDAVGEDTFDNIDLGSLGNINHSSGLQHSQPITGGVRREEPVEAELVEDPRVSDTQAASAFDSAGETIQLGAETMAEIRDAARALGDFALERKIGQGGMGEVWLARQMSLDRPVAVKVLPRQLATQDNFIERFRREAKAAASLVHPNVIQIYAYGIDEGTPYFAMEYVEGEDLQQRIRRERFLDWGEIVDILIGVGSALSVAHEKGLIHRDIKPSNIMIDRNGIVKVMDFGLAKATSGGPEAKSLTNAGLIMGTPNYLSPEQGRGDGLDGRSDLYSLGIVLYELLTGRLPFKADTPAGLIFKHVYEPPPPPLDIRNEIPPFLVEITLKLLEKDPDDRYKNSQEFLADLAEFYDNYDYYVDEAGERRPDSGYLDPDRVEGINGPKIHSTSGVVRTSSGQTRTSNSSRRNAVTEPVTRATFDEEATVAPGDLSDFDVEDDEEATLDQVPDRAATLREERETAAAAAAERRERERARRKPTAPPPPQRKGSKLPLLVILAFFLAVGGFAYLWVFEREKTEAWLVARGFYDRGPNPTPSGAAPVGTLVATSSPSLTPSVAITPARKNEVIYSYPLERWAEGVAVELARAKHDPYAMRRGSTGSYPLADDYRITFSRRGYEPISLEAKLVRDPDEPTQGALLDASGSDLADRELEWTPTQALRASYAQGHAALDLDDLQGAAKHLEEAAALDRDYRPAAQGGQVAASVKELQERLASRKQTLAEAEQRLEQRFQISEEHAKARRWRAALEVLAKVADKDQPEEWRQLAERCREGIRNGDRLVEAAQALLATGNHDRLASQLTGLAEADPAHAELSTLKAKLTAAKTLRAKAMVPLSEATLEAVRVHLDTYLTDYSPDDAQARARLEEVDAKIGVARKLDLELDDLRRLAKAKSWKTALRKARQILDRHPEATTAQEVRAQAEDALATEAIQETLVSLDGALVTGDVAKALAVFNPRGPAYATEKLALERLSHVRGVFSLSTHRDLDVQRQSGLAQVKAEWNFKLSILGQPAQSFTTTHVVQLRRVGQRWLVHELRVEGGVRAR